MDRIQIPIGTLIGQPKIKAYKISTPMETRITEERTPKGQTISILLEGPLLQVTDGHHTMDELYAHRHELFLALCKIYDNYITPLNTRIKCWKSKLHADGTMFDGWFILGMEITEFEGKPSQITYHLPIEYWHLANVMALEKAPEWDGHTSTDVLKRLRKL